MEFHMPFLSTT